MTEPTSPQGAAHENAGTVGAVLARRLSELGVRRIWGLRSSELRGLVHVPVEDVDLAVLLADVDGRLGGADGAGRLGAALVAGPILHLSSAPGGLAPLQTIGSVEELLDALIDPPGLRRPGTLALHLDLDLTAPVVGPVGPSAEPERTPVVTLDPSLAGLRIVVLAGPGVVRSGSMAALRSASRQLGAPVVATWGARGVESFQSAFDAGVGGLQDRDLELGGLASADVVVTTGLDPDEVPAGVLDSLVVQDVAPTQLAALCRNWPATSASEPVDRPSIRNALAPVLDPMYEDAGAPLSPARAALHLAGALPDGGVATSSRSPVGFWVARTFPTRFVHSLCVPATDAPGTAIAAALVAAFDDRVAVAVVDERDGPAVDATSAAVVDLARTLDRSIRVQVWSEDGPSLDADAHVAQVRAALRHFGVRIDVVGVRLDVPEALIELAGARRPGFDGRRDPA